MLAFVWEGRVVSYMGRNMIVLEKLGRSGNVIIENAKTGHRIMVHKSELLPRMRAPKRWKGR